MKIVIGCASVALGLSFSACGGDESGGGGSGGSGATTADATTTTATTATSTTSATTTTATTGVGGGGGEGGGEPFVSPCFGWSLQNGADTCGAASIAPLPGEESHWAAERLTPPSYPFTVTKFRHALVQSMDCTADLPHQVDVFVGTGVAPDPSPTIVAHFDFPAQAVSDGFLVFDTDLPVPIVLQAGEHLFISVQFAGVSPDVTCIGACEGAGFVADRSYWSNAGAAPFPWATIESFTIEDNYMICAEGTP